MHTLRNSARHRLLFGACLLSLFSAPAPAQQKPDAEQLERRQIILNCGEDGRTALRVASAYFENGRSKDATLAYARQQGEKGELLAGDLFPQAGEGLISGAPRFATQRVIRCLENNNFPMDREVTVEMSDLCWARSDAVYRSMAQKLAGKSRNEAEAVLLARFSNPVAFPPDYLRDINGVVYERVAGVPEANGTQVTVYLACLVAQVRAAARR